MLVDSFDGCFPNIATNFHARVYLPIDNF